MIKKIRGERNFIVITIIIYDSSRKEVFFYKGRNLGATLGETSESEPFTPVYTVPISLARKERKGKRREENIFLRTRYTNNTQGFIFSAQIFRRISYISRKGN